VFSGVHERLSAELILSEEKENAMAAEFHIRTLLMDLETASSSQQIMAANIRMIRADLISAKTVMGELRANWQGDSALEYFNLFDTTISALEEYIRRWEEMTERFGNEIPAWEDMALHLAGTS
jgi:uncharacterized protein YukE